MPISKIRNVIFFDIGIPSNETHEEDACLNERIKASICNL